MKPAFKKPIRNLAVALVMVILLSFRPLPGADAYAGSEWKTAVREMVYNKESEKVADYLVPYATYDQEAKILYAVFLSQDANATEDYRDVVAEMIDDGVDVEALLNRVSEEVLGFIQTLDYNGMAFNSYCIGNIKTAESIAAYRARKGDLFARSLVAHSIFNVKLRQDAYAHTGLSTEEFRQWIEENVQVNDPVAMYVEADIYTYNEVEPDADYYTMAADLLQILAQGGKITYGYENADPQGTLGLQSLLTGLDMSSNNPLISYYIGECYRYGDGVFAQDKAQAEKWYRQAAERGLPEAQMNLGHILLFKLIRDQVTDADYNSVVNECYTYLTGAASKGYNYLSEYDLALFYLAMGDQESGNQWMKVAAEDGSPQALAYIQNNTLMLFDWM